MLTTCSRKNIFSIVLISMLLLAFCGCGPINANMHKYMTNSNCYLKVVNELPGGKGNFLKAVFIEFNPPLDRILKDYMCSNVSNELEYNSLYIVLKNAKMELLAGNNLIDDMVSTLDAQYTYKKGEKSIIQDISVHRIETENGFTGKRAADVNFIELIKQLDLKIKDSIKMQLRPS